MDAMTRQESRANKRRRHLTEGGGEDGFGLQASIVHVHAVLVVQQLLGVGERVWVSGEWGSVRVSAKMAR